MSSYHVGDAHINAILTYARLVNAYLPKCNGTGAYDYATGDDHLTAVGRAMDNFNNIASEWGNDDSKFVFKLDSNVVLFHKSSPKACAAHMVNMIKCFEYQCDTYSTFQETEIALIARRIMDGAIDILTKGYGDLTWNYSGKFKG